MADPGFLKGSFSSTKTPELKTPQKKNFGDFRGNLETPGSATGLHKYIRQQQKVKHTIGPLKQTDGIATITNEVSAEALAGFLKSVFVHEDIQNFPAGISLHLRLLKNWYIINFQISFSTRPPVPMKYILTYYLHFVTIFVNLLV